MTDEGLFWINDDSMEKRVRSTKPKRNKIERDLDQRRAIVDSLRSVRENNRFEWDDVTSQSKEPESFIFRVIVDDQRKLRSSEAIKNNAMTINYMMDERYGIVSTSRDAFKIMEGKAASYAESGKYKTRFDDFKSISSNNDGAKFTEALSKSLDGSGGKRQVRLQMVPGIGKRDMDAWIGGIRRVVENGGGSLSCPVVS